MTEVVRLSKVMANRGLCSRREADKMIEAGLVRVDGEVVSQLGSKVPLNVDIQLASVAKEARDAAVTIMINKPVGYVSGQAEDDYVPAVRLFNADNQYHDGSSYTRFNNKHTRKLAPAGRLDIDSQGLLIMTQDGRVAKALIGENSQIEKEYLVRLDGSVSGQKIRELSHGLELDGKKLKPAKVRVQNEDQLNFILTEGKKRQIRRMCELVNLKVIGIKRVRIGRLRLGKLPEGQWQYVDRSYFVDS
ncbi:MAG TPA: pseudouridylate synthase [Gammaproteobacteria bacterium]|jgi:23S rRNA pseudouridine2604 synthase|nr:pseudouridylate synthase [Gammaproteobacteria bacterium]